MASLLPDGYDYLFKVIVLGDTSVGKTSLLRRFCCKNFTGNYNATIGVDYLVCDVNLVHKNKEVKVKLHLWDTSGEERHKALASVYYRNADCVILVFDINCKDSFDNIPKWLSNAYDHCGDTHKVLVANKCDLDPKVSYQDIKEIAYYNNLHWVETSAKDSTNVEETFEKLVKELVEQREQLLSLGSLSKGPESIFFNENDPNPPQNEGYCCTYI